MSAPIIQVDMYAVGLGAGLLIQHRLPGSAHVRILADAGMGHGYAAEGVHDRLPEALSAFDENAERRIDLIIGTHYDADHLKGLVPIVEDDSIDIGAVWLPPIKDDTGEIPGHPSDASDFLPQAFFDSPGDELLLEYLAKKRLKIEEAAREEQFVEDVLSDGSNFPSASKRYRRVRRDHPVLEGRPSIADYERYFDAEEMRWTPETGSEAPHDTDVFNSSVPDAVERARRALAATEFAKSGPSARLSFSPTNARLALALLANIRKATARSAITAINLHMVVTALKQRAHAVRPECHYIASGEPARFVWEAGKRRFIKRAKGGSGGVVLSLLGPSEDLVEKHREKLPIGAYMFALAKDFTPIKREGITASNQLSYILTLESSEQRILVSGDAGCYGFMDESKQYFPRLLQALKHLHVVQIAHHAGHNYDFYNALLKSGFAEQTEFAHLLLSHDVEDKSRPSAAFAEFIAQIREEEDDVRLLFTSRPLKEKVRDFDELICDVVSPTGPADYGDARLVYGGSGRSKVWTVEKHVVAVK
jgi:hypothetical protein